MAREKSLHFYGPYTICSEVGDILHDCPYASKKGIYLWTAKMRGGEFKVLYIGETSKSFYKRTKEHLIQTLGGNYQILNPTAMLHGKLEIIWDGLWRKGTQNKFPEFLLQYEDLASSIKKFVINQRLFVAPINIERRLRQRIEGALANVIQSEDKASSLFAKDIRYYPRKDVEEPLFFLISSDKKLRGYPNNYRCENYLPSTVNPKEQISFQKNNR